MLLRDDVLRIHVIWREEMAGLESVTSRTLNRTHRQKLIWQVGFLFWSEIEPCEGKWNVPNSFREVEKAMNVPEIRAEDLKRRLDAGENLFLLDVRDEFEYATSNIGGHLIPLAELPGRVNELDASQKIVAVCKMGPRGAKAVQFLHKAGFNQVWNLSGGIHAWSDRVDHGVPKY
jgi:adenylyltransferase/sulfurtransferase